MLSVWRSMWPCLLVAILLSLADAFARLTYTGRRHVGSAPLAWFNAAHEWTIPTWFSVLTMAAIAVTSWRVTGTSPGAWRVLGCLFGYLAVDDLLGLHELAGAFVHPWVEGWGVYSWVLVVAPVFAIIACWCAVRLWRDLETRPAHRLTLLLGFALLAAAIACEAGENWSTQSSLRIRGLPLLEHAQWLEETIELIAPVVILAAVRGAGTSAPPAVTPSRSSATACGD